jgi:hypothetical protein
MNPARYRDECGSHRGMVAHQIADEEFCGACLMGEAGRRLYRELIPTRPTPPPAAEPGSPRDLVDAVAPLRSVA